MIYCTRIYHVEWLYQRWFMWTMRLTTSADVPIDSTVIYILDDNDCNRIRTKNITIECKISSEPNYSGTQSAFIDALSPVYDVLNIDYNHPTIKKNCLKDWICYPIIRVYTIELLTGSKKNIARICAWQSKMVQSPGRTCNWWLI